MSKFPSFVCFFQLADDLPCILSVGRFTVPKSGRIPDDQIFQRVAVDVFGLRVHSCPNLCDAHIVQGVDGAALSASSRSGDQQVHLFALHLFEQLQQALMLLRRACHFRKLFANPFKDIVCVHKSPS